MAVKPIPDELPRVMPYLAIDGATQAIDFYKDVFGAAERVRMDAPGGKVGHAEIEIGDSVIMLSDESPDMGNKGPTALGGTPVTLCVYVENVDEVFDRAVALGAKPIRAVQDQFYGDRSGTFDDPFGHRWNVATHVEDVPPEEMERRAADAMAQMGGEGGG